MANQITWAVAGLGNPGAEYASTRHNCGFLAMDRLLESLKAPEPRLKRRGLECAVLLPQGKILLIKPQTYMNASGECLRDELTFYKLDSSKLIVIYDDIDLPVGALRIRERGGPGTHNGMRSITEVLGTENFPRIRIGTGKPPQGYDLADYVLGRIPASEREAVQQAVASAAEAALCITENGIEAAMQKYNKK